MRHLERKTKKRTKQKNTFKVASEAHGRLSSRIATSHPPRHGCHFLILTHLGLVKVMIAAVLPACKASKAAVINAEGSRVHC